jgi:hypothetical protein
MDSAPRKRYCCVWQGVLFSRREALSRQLNAQIAWDRDSICGWLRSEAELRLQQEHVMRLYKSSGQRTAIGDQAKTKPQSQALLSALCSYFC